MWIVDKFLSEPMLVIVEPLSVYCENFVTTSLAIFS